MGLEQHHPIATKPRSWKNALRQYTKSICNDDYRYWTPNAAPVTSQFITVLPTEQIRTRSGNAEERDTEVIRSTLLWIIPSDLLTSMSTSVLLTSKTRPLKINSVLYTGRIHNNLQTFSFVFSLFLTTHCIYTKNYKYRGEDMEQFKKAVKNEELGLVEITFSLRKRK